MTTRLKPSLPLAFALCTLFSLLAAEPLSAQFQLEAPRPARARRHAKAEVLLERAAVPPGGELRVAIRIEIDKGWHLYHDRLGPPDAVGKPTRIELRAEDVAFGRTVFPEPDRLPQPGLGEGGRNTWIYAHHGTIYVFALGKVAKDAEHGPRKLEVRIDGLTCEEKGSCVPYRETLEADFEIAAAPGTTRHADVFSRFPPPEAFAPEEPAPPSRPQESERSPPEASASGPPSEGGFPEGFDLSAYQPRNLEAERSFLLYILLGLLAGFILNFMPCVLPVISIKVLSFVQQAGEDPARVFRLGLVFAAGILSVFVVLASLAAFAGQSWGEQFQSQTFLIVMIAIVFGFALSLFGVYELTVPQTVTRLGVSAPREGYGDAFFKGVMATALATPCSGPFLGSTLAWALSQPAVVVYTIFLAIGAGMAFPYVLLTARPRWLGWLPKPGPWMETFKHIMGFVLLFTVIYLMVSLEQQRILFTVTFLVFVALAAWIYGRYGPHTAAFARRVGACLAAVATVALGAYLSFGVFQGMFEPSHSSWEEFDFRTFVTYQKEGRNIMVDWTADWCPNCKYVEKVVLESDEIQALVARKKVVMLKADITHDNEKTRLLEAFMNQLGSRSIPFLAVFPGDDPTRPYVLRDVYTRSQLRAILEALPDPPAPAS